MAELIHVKTSHPLENSHKFLPGFEWLLFYKFSPINGSLASRSRIKSPLINDSTPCTVPGMIGLQKSVICFDKNSDPESDPTNSLYSSSEFCKKNMTEFQAGKLAAINDFKSFRVKMNVKSFHLLNFHQNFRYLCRNTGIMVYLFTIVKL